jgi:hypothetical protein
MNVNISASVFMGRCSIILAVDTIPTLFVIEKMPFDMFLANNPAPTPTPTPTPTPPFHSLLNCPGKKWASKGGMLSYSNLTATFFGYDRPSRMRVTVPDNPTEHNPSPTSYPST